MLFIYLIIHLYFIYALLLFSNSMKMIKVYRNMSEFRQILCKNILQHSCIYWSNCVNNWQNLLLNPEPFQRKVRAVTAFRLSEISSSLSISS